jgi:hypothetical protein
MNRRVTTKNVYRELHCFENGLKNKTVGRVDFAEETVG